MFLSISSEYFYGDIFEYEYDTNPNIESDYVELSKPKTASRFTTKSRTRTRARSRVRAPRISRRKQVTTTSEPIPLIPVSKFIEVSTVTPQTKPMPDITEATEDYLTFLPDDEQLITVKSESVEFNETLSGENI